MVVCGDIITTTIIMMIAIVIAAVEVEVDCVTIFIITIMIIITRVEVEVDRNVERPLQPRRPLELPCGRDGLQRGQVRYCLPRQHHHHCH